MGYVGAFLLVLSVATLAQGENGIHELAGQRASKYELVTVTQLVEYELYSSNIFMFTTLFISN